VLGGKLGRKPEKRPQRKEDILYNGKVLPGIGFVDLPEDVTITLIACGEPHTLAISDGRKLYAWGTNPYGQLELGGTEDRETPCKVHIDAEYLKDIAGGGAHSMVLDNEGQIFTWGLGEGGRLEHGEINLELMPKKLETLKKPAF
jgi:alpha-tubulin suppressor-like RCC1 family protein